MRVERHGVVVVGAGVAGLAAAITAATVPGGPAGGTVTVLVDTTIGGGSSPWAQGGLAAAVDAADSPASHAADTLAVSGGLGDRDAVDVLTGGAPDAVAWLRSLGTRFDVDATGELALGREAGHRARRIVHAHGDATGAEIMRALVEVARQTPNLVLREHSVAVDLVRAGDRVVGVVALEGGRQVLHLAGAVLLASGGYGHLFARTTTPPVVRGGAVAMACRAGAAVADLEMVQFHPTALAAPGADPLPLLTEALRGEGATLIDRDGHRFMVDEHPDAELAPRDVVARANYRVQQAGGAPALDARSIGPDFPDRFPTVFALARAHGFDPRTDVLPVSPAAHYCMGGVATDVDGRSSLLGLWVIGEAASTGAHGANRLASNSVLEGVVMGRRVAPLLAGAVAPDVDGVEVPAGTPLVRGTNPGPVFGAVREVLWHHAGVVRDGAGITAGLAALDTLDAEGEPEDVPGRNALVVARAVLEAAAARTESRGAHFRSDHPTADPAQASRRVVQPTAVATVTLSVGATVAEVASASSVRS